MTRVLITGGRAKTGAPLAALLAQRPGVEVLGGTSDPDRLQVQGVVPVAFSWDDPATGAAAVRDVDAVFVVRPDRADAPELLADLLAATPRHAHVVLLSELDNGYFGEQDWAPRVERVLRDAARTWTVLRPGWYMQVFTDPRFLLEDLVEDGRLPFPGGGQAVAWIDARDIAAVAEQALLDPGRHHGHTYDLTGPEALTLPQTAELLAPLAGGPVEHVELSMEQAVAGREGFDRANDWGAFDRIRIGAAAAVTDTVRQVTGHRARSVQDFVADHGGAVTQP